MSPATGVRRGGGAAKAGPEDSPAITVAVVDDYEVVVRGLTTMLQRFRERVVVLELDAEAGPDVPIDVVLYDTFGHLGSGGERIRELAGSELVRRVAVYTWNSQSALVGSSLEQGAAGYLSKTLGGAQLVEAIERIHAGETVVSESAGGAHLAQDWAGRDEGLSPRESEVLTLITQGMSNEQIAAQTHVSINSVKSYIRAAYRKIGARSRSQAVLWGVQHGLQPPAPPEPDRAESEPMAALDPVTRFGSDERPRRALAARSGTRRHR